MAFIQLNDDGDVVGVFADPQTSIETIEVDDDDPRIAAFHETRVQMVADLVAVNKAESGLKD